MTWNSGPCLPDLPPRSLHARPATEADGNEGRGGLVVTCDCGESCLLTFEPRTPEGREIPPGTPAAVLTQEIAYTCDGCLSVTWLTLTAPTGE